MLALYPERQHDSTLSNNNKGDDDRPASTSRHTSTSPIATTNNNPKQKNNNNNNNNNNNSSSTSSNMLGNSLASSFAAGSVKRDSSARLLAGAGFGELPVTLVVHTFALLIDADDARLLDAARVCRRWRLLALASALWRALLLAAPRMADGRPRPRLRRRFFQRAMPLLLSGYPVSYTRRMAVLDEVFTEFNLESIAAVYAS
jgi:hypothetical protein